LKLLPIHPLFQYGSHTAVTSANGVDPSLFQSGGHTTVTPVNEIDPSSLQSAEHCLVSTYFYNFWFFIPTKTSALTEMLIISKADTTRKVCVSSGKSTKYV
jgi:hypothetical protein